MEITPKLIQELREKTGAGIMDCKRALAETAGDLEKAIVWLREKGIAAAAGRAGRVASEGAVGSYIHAGGKIGVLIEVNCETDFCAKSEAFQALVKELALQVAALNPRVVRREESVARRHRAGAADLRVAGRGQARGGRRRRSSTASSRNFTRKPACSSRLTRAIRTRPSTI